MYLFVIWTKACQECASAGYFLVAANFNSAYSSLNTRMETFNSYEPSLTHTEDF